MKVSFSVATARPTYWRRFCEALAKNAAEMEVAFVGPVNGGEKDLPVPARFVDVPVEKAGAARCWEIGARLSTGDLLCLIADDCVLSPGCVDSAVAEASKPHDAHDLFTARYVHNGADSLYAQRLWCEKGMPLLPVGGFGYVETHRQVGGIDRRFLGVYWDADLYMDLVSRGGQTTLLEGHTCREENEDHHLYSRCNGQDGELLNALWPLPRSADMKRASPREPWEDFA